VRKCGGVEIVVVQRPGGGAVAARVAGDVVVGAKPEAGNVQIVGQVPEAAWEPVLAGDEPPSGRVAVYGAGVDVHGVEAKGPQAGLFEGGGRVPNVSLGR